jgi:hypothetical protein
MSARAPQSAHDDRVESECRVSMDVMDNTADIRARALADLTRAAQHGGDELPAAMRTAFVAGVEPFEIAEASGLDEQQVRDILGAV